MANGDVEERNPMSDTTGPQGQQPVSELSNNDNHPFKVTVARNRCGE
jgi:hypothetical protein